MITYKTNLFIYKNKSKVHKNIFLYSIGKMALRNKIMYNYFVILNKYIDIFYNNIVDFRLIRRI